jgi:hypothetical protein
MFHQVGPVGPFDEGTRLVSPRAELAPIGDGSGEWGVRDRGALRYRAPLDRYRVSVLWKADIYPDEAERARQCANALSFPDIARVFGEDLARRGVDLRVTPDRLEDLAFAGALAAHYP